jgi:methionyl-tRNA formyltransferase
MTLRVYVSGQKSFGAAVAALVISSGYRLTGVASPAWSFSAAARVGRRRPAGPATARRRTARSAVGGVRGHGPLPCIPAGTDVIVAAHSHAFVGAKSRARAALASVGYHPSLLPLHRGRDAVRWTIHDRDRVTGGSVYHLTNAVDGGPLAAQDYVLVPPGITATELWRELLFPLGLRLLRETLADMAAGVVVRTARRGVRKLGALLGASQAALPRPARTAVRPQRRALRRGLGRASRPGLILPRPTAARSGPGSDAFHAPSSASRSGSQPARGRATPSTMSGSGNVGAFAISLPGSGSDRTGGATRRRRGL